MKGLEKKVYEKLDKVIDPELNISITELGLIYKVEVIENEAIITMTLTSIGCPLFYLFEDQIQTKVKEVKEIKVVKINLVFDPVWTIERMSKKAKDKFGFLQA